MAAVAATPATDKLRRQKEVSGGYCWRRWLTHVVPEIMEDAEASTADDDTAAEAAAELEAAADALKDAMREAGRQDVLLLAPTVT